MSVALFAYHELGDRCLELLLEREVPVVAVFTHEDDASEDCWFGSVGERARAAGIPTYTPLDPNEPRWTEILAGHAPSVLLSAHYRRLLRRPLRRVPTLGSFNLHTSLLPRYRGRCPLNWQLVHGEERSGVTLHRMVARADAGELIDQEPIAVGPDETALELYRRLVPTAVAVLGRSLDGLLTGTAVGRPQDEALATTFGGRRPADGRIEWSWPANRIHDLVRAVAPPWPGAFSDSPLGPVAVHRTSRRVPPAPPGLRLGEVWAPAPNEVYVQALDGLLRLEQHVAPPGLRLESGVRLVKGAAE